MTLTKLKKLRIEWLIPVNYGLFVTMPLLFKTILCYILSWNMIHTQSKTNQQLANQGVLENCKDVEITKADLQKAQALLNPSIRRPEIEDWERKRKYFGDVPTDFV